MPSTTTPPLFHDAVRRQAARQPAWRLFERRIRSPREAMRALPPTPVAHPDAGPALGAALDRTGADAERVVYVHVPYCASLCSFCGYHRSLVPPGLALERYAEAVARQAETFALSSWCRQRPFSALQIGGGTPTVLPTSVLSAMVRRIRDAVAFTPDAEITVESTVTHLDAAATAALARAGVNRVALGVQSFDTALRHAVGRCASGAQILSRITEVREAGIDNVNLDLIYGLPNQTAVQWAADVEAALASGATSLSIYPLITFPSSQLGAQCAAEGRSLPDLEAEHGFCVHADRALSIVGWRRLTPVQYGNRDEERASYVCAQSVGADVLALGSGAAGRIGRLVYLNSPDVEAFVRGGSAAESWPVGVVREDARHEAARWLHGFAGATPRQASGPAEVETIADEAHERLLHLELATSEEGGLSLTGDGCFWAANICEALTGAVKAAYPEPSLESRS